MVRPKCSKSKRLRNSDEAAAALTRARSLHDAQALKRTVAQCFGVSFAHERTFGNVPGQYVSHLLRRHRRERASHSPKCSVERLTRDVKLVRPE